MSVSGKLFNVSAANVTMERMAQAEAIKARVDGVIGELVDFIKASIVTAGADADLALGHFKFDSETSDCSQSIHIELDEEMTLEIEVSVYVDSVYREIARMEEDKQDVDIAAAVDKYLLAGPFIHREGMTHSYQHDSWFPRLLADKEKGRFSREDYELADQADRQDLLAGIGRAIVHSKTFVPKTESGPQPR